MEIDSQPLLTPQKSSSNIGCLNPIILVAIIGWIALITFFRHYLTFGTTLNPGPATRIAALSGTLIGAILIAIATLPLAIWWPDQRFRRVYQGWSLATILMILLLPVQALDLIAAQAQAVLHILLTLLFCGLILFFIKFKQRKLEISRNPSQEMADGGLLNHWLFALLVSSISAFPWLALGALGSLVDTLLQLCFALILGFAASLILEYFLFYELRTAPIIPRGSFIVAGLGSSTVLLLLANATSFGFGGMQILLMMVLPGLGWSITAFQLIQIIKARNSQIKQISNQQKPVHFSNKLVLRNSLPYALLIGLVAAAPTALIDPDELILVVSSTAGEILGKAYLAASLSMMASVFIGMLLLALLLIKRTQFNQPIKETSPRGSMASGFLALLAIGIAAQIYFIIGQPGFYGERIFVILKEQADLSPAQEISGYEDRREYVYSTLVKHAETTQAGLRQDLDRFRIDYTPYYLVNAIEINNNPIIRLWLLTRPEVDRILESPRMRPLPSQPPISTGWLDAPTNIDWNLKLIQADRVWDEFNITGENIVVGQSDSGADASHSELAKSYRGADGDHNYNWFDPWNGTHSPTDIGGHGTHTLGSIVGEHTGVAPGATWYACVNLARNLGNPALYLDCMQFMLAPFPLHGDPFVYGKPAAGAHIINNSWGCPDIEGCDADTFYYAIQALRAAGVFVVASAGNDGPGCETLNSPPPIYKGAFAVGAIDQFGELASFSSIGPVTADGSDRFKPDIVAPGVAVLSALPENTYGRYSGTSMAGPHVVGVVALMWSANPSLIGDIEATEQILIQSADKYTGTLPDCSGANSYPSTAVGYGILNAYEAVRMALGSNQ